MCTSTPLSSGGARRVGLDRLVLPELRRLPPLPSWSRRRWASFRSSSNSRCSSNPRPRRSSRRPRRRVVRFPRRRAVRFPRRRVVRFPRRRTAARRARAEARPTPVEHARAECAGSDRSGCVGARGASLGSPRAAGQDPSRVRLQSLFPAALPQRAGRVFGRRAGRGHRGDRRGAGRAHALAPTPRRLRSWCPDGGCDLLDILFGPIEVNPGCGCDDDLDQIVTVGEAKLSANVDGIDGAAHARRSGDRHRAVACGVVGGHAGGPAAHARHRPLLQVDRRVTDVS